MIKRIYNWFKNLFKKPKQKPKKYLKINDGVGGRPDDRKGGS